MNTTFNTGKKFVAGAVGAAIAGMAAPALLFLGAGSAQAAQTVIETDRTVTTQGPAHVEIQVKPPLVSPPLIWGPFDTPIYFLGN